MSSADPLMEAHWRGGVDAKLDQIAQNLVTLSTEKEATHRTLYSRLEAVEQRQAEDRAENAARWARLFGLGIGLMIGAGAAGGAGGALITQLLTN